jgi:hypothetical protein
MNDTMASRSSLGRSVITVDIAVYGADGVDDLELWVPMWKAVGVTLK